MMVRQAEDDWLIERARRGDLDAFNTIVHRQQTGIYNLCLHMLGQRQAAEDTTQECFLLAFRAINRFEGGNLRAWLMRIAANACYDELRRRARRPASSLDALADDPERPFVPATPEPGPEAEALQSELRREIERGLLTLGPEQRLAVVLCDVQGLSYDEIAEVMHSSLGTVKSRVSRGRARLREYLAQSGEPFRAVKRQDM